MFLPHIAGHKDYFLRYKFKIIFSFVNILFKKINIFYSNKYKYDIYINYTSLWTKNL
jgi:hypothetical protein